jgi:hypothetical protein
MGRLRCDGAEPSPTMGKLSFSQSVIVRDLDASSAASSKRQSLGSRGIAESETKLNRCTLLWQVAA